MKKNSIATLAVVVLLLAASLARVKVVTASDGFPTSDTPTLTTSLSPSNATLGQNVTWLIWTDPNCSGHLVNLKIFDEWNSTTVFDENRTLGTLNACGSWKETVPTTGFAEDEYRFTATLEVDGMKMESTRYLDFQVSHFSLYSYVSPYDSIPGEGIKLTMYETVYPYVNASADVLVFNDTNPSLWTMNDVEIPASNGSRIIDIPTSGWIAGSYSVNVTATSSMGTSQTTTYFWLTDLIVTTDKFGYYIGQQVNVSIRTYSTVSEAGLTIYHGFMPPEVVAHEYIPLTDGHGSKLYDTSSWSPDYYYVICNATINLDTAFASAYFYLDAFSVNVDTDKYTYTAGEPVNISISTTPPQSNAIFNVTITNSTDDVIWTYGPSNLDVNGEASVIFDSTDLPPDDYLIKVWVNNTHYERSDTVSFEIAATVFDIYADVQPYYNSGYAMPVLNTTVVPAQSHANITIEVSAWFGTVYTFTKEDFSISTYNYLLPVVGMSNSTYWVDVHVSSSGGTNSTWHYFYYENGLDSDGDGLSDSQERAIFTFPENPDTDGDGFFDGLEVFHGSNPLDPSSVIPEQPFVQIIALLCTTPLIYVVAKKKRFLKQ